MAECEAILAHEDWCHAPADQLYLLGCAHEHIMRHYLCPLCAFCVLLCQACWLVDGHRCRLSVTTVDKGENLATSLGSPEG